MVSLSASEHAFKEIFTSLPKPGGGEFGKFYSLPALNDPRIGNSSELGLLHFAVTTYFSDLKLFIGPSFSALFFDCCF